MSQRGSSLARNCSVVTVPWVKGVEDPELHPNTLWYSSVCACLAAPPFWRAVSRVPLLPTGLSNGFQDQTTGVSKGAMVSCCLPRSHASRPHPASLAMGCIGGL